MADLPLTGGGVRSDSSGRSGRSTPSGVGDDQEPPVDSHPPMPYRSLEGASQSPLSVDSLCAAFAPVLSDFTIQ